MRSKYAFPVKVSAVAPDFERRASCKIAVEYGKIQVVRIADTSIGGFRVAMSSIAPITTLDFAWSGFVPSFSLDTDSLAMTTMPHTDLWQRTYYHFRNDNAPLFLTNCAEKHFSFSVKTDFSESRHRFDQCGIVLYLDSENWLKASVEYENGSFAHLGSVVTNHGYSDWATTNIAASVKTMWYRLSRRDEDFLVECSRDGVEYAQMRICHLFEVKDSVRFGVYACSPEDSSFRARFTDFRLEECQWKAHDGQPPDNT